MVKALIMDPQVFWWIGLHSPLKSDEFIWSSTEEAHALTHSWWNKTPEIATVDENQCIGFNISGT